MEIERKFTIKELPADLESYPFHHIEQAYLNASPVVRVRKEDDEYYLTYKGSGMMTREESNLPLNREAYYHLRAKADGRIISKRRYLIPLPNPGFQESTGLPYPPSDYSLTIELDIFQGIYEGLALAEVEFSTEKEAMAFTTPAWFGRDVTFSGEYQNSRLSQGLIPADFSPAGTAPA